MIGQPLTIPQLEALGAQNADKIVRFLEPLHAADSVIPTHPDQAVEEIVADVLRDLRVEVGKPFVVQIISLPHLPESLRPLSSLFRTLVLEGLDGVLGALDEALISIFMDAAGGPKDYYNEQLGEVVSASVIDPWKERLEGILSAMDWDDRPDCYGLEEAVQEIIEYPVQLAAYGIDLTEKVAPLVQLLLNGYYFLGFYKDDLVIVVATK